MSGQPAQTKTIRSQLLADMKDGAYASCERLPRESVLAEKLGISRTQLRDILASLEREGFITRRHGVGTIINRHVLNVQTRMDIEVEFLDMIRQSGHEPAVAFVRVSDGTADAQVAAQLRIPEDTPIIRIARLCTADGRPAIYCEDVVEKALAKGGLHHPGLQAPHLPLPPAVLRHLSLSGSDRRAARRGGCRPGGDLPGAHGHAAAEHGRGGL